MNDENIHHCILLITALIANWHYSSLEICDRNQNSRKWNRNHSLLGSFSMRFHSHVSLCRNPITETFHLWTRTTSEVVFNGRLFQMFYYSVWSHRSTNFFFFTNLSKKKRSNWFMINVFAYFIDNFFFRPISVKNCLDYMLNYSLWFTVQVLGRPKVYFLIEFIVQRFTFPQRVLYPTEKNILSYYM